MDYYSHAHIHTFQKHMHCAWDGYIAVYKCNYSVWRMLYSKWQANPLTCSEHLYLLTQVGSSPLHSWLSWHNLVAMPFNLYLVLQLYSTIDPIVVEVRFLVPISGVPGSPQEPGTIPIASACARYTIKDNKICNRSVSNRFSNEYTVPLAAPCTPNIWCYTVNHQ